MDDGVLADAKPPCVALVPMVTAAKMVVSFQFATVAVQFDICRAFDRNRRTRSADPQPAAGNPRRCSECLQHQPSTGSLAPACGRVNSSESV